MSPTTEPRATLQAIWRTRPSRRQADRKIAGVAAAIGRRYDLDPVLVRIGFVVASVYGVGIVLYLAAWATLPVDPADPPTGPLRGKNGGTSVHPIVLVAAGLAGLGAIGSLLRGDPGVLVGFAVIGGLVYLLHQSRGARAVGPATPGGVTPGAAEGIRAIPAGAEGPTTMPASRTPGRRGRPARGPPTRRPRGNRRRQPGTRSASPRSPGTCPSLEPSPRIPSTHRVDAARD